MAAHIKNRITSLPPIVRIRSCELDINVLKDINVLNEEIIYLHHKLKKLQREVEQHKLNHIAHQI